MLLLFVHWRLHHHQWAKIGFVEVFALHTTRK
jgi:hypothetical protein